MFKSIQIKIILILIIVSLLMIIGTGFIYISSLEKTKEAVEEKEVIQSNIDNTKTVLIIVSSSFLIMRSSHSDIFFKSNNCSDSKTYKQC